MAELSGAHWRKSTRSGGNGGNCVEVADLVGRVGVRDSKDVGGGVLAFEPYRWSTFVAAVKAGHITG
jgi:hypothetical protein